MSTIVTTINGTVKKYSLFTIIEVIIGSKKVHWKLVAKEQGMYLKDFVEGGYSVNQWFDIRDFPEHISFERKLNYLCFLILSAEKQSLQYGLKLYHQKTTLASGENHLHHCLSLLSLAKL